jgi:hypothetical protein
MEYLAHDTKNDIALIKSHGVYYVRYRLSVAEFQDPVAALDEYNESLRHALGLTFAVSHMNEEA